VNANAKLTFKRDRRRGLVMMHVDQTQYGVAVQRERALMALLGLLVGALGTWMVLA
jgi:hypothetical protein